jgi:hypothetical protein
MTVSPVGTAQESSKHVSRIVFHTRLAQQCHKLLLETPLLVAVRLSKAFGGSAETWLTQQAHYDLAQVRADRINLKRFPLA